MEIEGKPLISHCHDGSEPRTIVTAQFFKKLNKKVTAIQGEGWTCMKVWPISSSTSSIDAILPATMSTKMSNIYPTYPLEILFMSYLLGYGEHSTVTL
jgi:hypothetical protein